MPRPIILTSVGHYLPGFRAGGPVRSIAHLVEHLADEFDFRILTSGRDLGDDAPYAGVEPDRWLSVGPARVHYTSPTRQGPRGMAAILRDVPHDLLYLNSFFSSRFTVLPLALRRLGIVPRRPTVLAPRGEFSPGALAIRAPKKRGYIAVGRALGLFSGLRWQASSSFEARDIRDIFGKHAEVIIAPNLPAPPLDRLPPHLPRAEGAPLRLLFLGRIAPMKNLDFALRVMARVRRPVTFDIFGPPEDEAYRLACLDAAAAIPAHVEVRWRGPVLPDEVPGLMARHDLFFFPTRGENYGHVIAEALAAGTPVLVSDATPWRGLAQAGIGDDLPLDDPAAFAARIDTLAAEPAEMAQARRARAAAHMRQEARLEADVLANRTLFRAALGVA